MSFPVGVATTTLTGTYLDPEGNPLQGTITFSLPWVLTLPTAKIISAFPAQVTLDQYGKFSVELISTDNTGMSPTNWTYLVTERLSGQVAQPGMPVRQYSVFLPQSPSTIDIAQISPTSPTSGTYLPVVGPVKAIATAVTGNYTVTLTDQTVLVDATAGAVTVTLLSAASAFNLYHVKKIDSSGNAVTVAVQAGEHIDGASTAVLSSQWAVATFAAAQVSSAWSWYKL